MNNQCQNYKQKLQELKDLRDIFKQELKRANEDGKEHNDKGKSIIELKSQIQKKINNFEEEFKEFLSQTIKATTPEGEPIEFNLEQILNENKESYNNLNLTKWSEELPESISLTEEQIQNIKEKVEKFGFNKMRILPSIETQNSTLQKLAEETHRPIDGLPDDEQYSDKGIRLSDIVKPEFPDNIKTLNRPKGKCYIQLYKDEREVPYDTLGKSEDEARTWLKENDLQGYTQAEYLIFQREFTAKNKNHPDNDNWTWVTDSELSSSRVPGSGWDPGDRRVDVHSSGSDYRNGNLGFRSSAVLEL